MTSAMGYRRLPLLIRVVNRDYSVARVGLKAECRNGSGLSWLPLLIGIVKADYFVAHACWPKS